MSKSKMASRIKQSLGALALALVAQATLAAPNWQINPLGQGVGGASAVSALGIDGVGFVQLLPISQQGFAFIEQGAYRVALSGSPEITVTYSVAGTGLFADPFALHFNSGSINLYADSNVDFATSAGNYGANNGTLFGRFNVFDGSVAKTGMVNLSARLDASSLLAGYLFDAAGNDLITARQVLLQLGIFNQRTVPDALMLSEIVCELAGYPGAGCDGTPYADSPLAFAVRDGGSLSLSVPEPGSSGLLIAGLGLLPLAARRRRALAG